MGFSICSPAALSQEQPFLRLGIMPYISASIILQLLTVVIPSLGKLAKEGESGRKKITSIPGMELCWISIVQSLGYRSALRAWGRGRLSRIRDGNQTYNDDYNDIWHSLYHVAWRADNREGHRQWYFPYNIAGIVAGFPNAIISSVALSGPANCIFLLCFLYWL